VDDFARDLKKTPGELGDKRGRLEEAELRKEADGKDGKGDKGKADRERLRRALDEKATFEEGQRALAGRDLNRVQAGKLGVDLSVLSANLRGQSQLSRTAVRQVHGRTCLEIGGVWIDEGFTDKMPTLVVKAQSDAYFQILQKQPKLKDVFRLGNYLVWVTPSGTALIIDTGKGKDKLTDEEIDKLFVARK
jgi:Ca-activated chloride channel family protein